METKSLGELVVFLRFCTQKQTKNDGNSAGEESDGSSNGDTGKDGNNEKQTADNDVDTEKTIKTKPTNLPWLVDNSWRYFVQFEEKFEELQGKAKSYTGK